MTRPRTTEAAEQEALFAWRDALRGQYHALRLMVHVPNEGKRAPWVARASGITAGVPDVLVLAPRGEYAGLALELKRKDNTVTEDQSAMLRALRAEGWYVAVVTFDLPGDWVHAAAIIAAYLDMPAHALPDLARAGAEHG